MPRTLVALSLLAFLAPLAASQATASVINTYGSIPACGANCQNILIAQAGCVPNSAGTGAPVSNQATYDNCFCNSNFLTNLKNSPDGTCDAECPAESDRQAVQAWFTNFCSAGLAAAEAAGASSSASPSSTSVAAAVTATPLPSTTLATQASTTAAAAAAATTSSSGGATSSNGVAYVQTGSWWSNHKQWIAMVIVLIIGFTLIIVGGVLWKRRVKRRRNNAASMPVPVAWGPHQNQSFTGGINYPTGAPEEEKFIGKGKARYGADYLEANEKGRSGKLQKLFRRS